MVGTHQGGTVARCQSCRQAYFLPGVCRETGIYCVVALPRHSRIPGIPGEWQALGGSDGGLIADQNSGQRGSNLSSKPWTLKG
eukprot:737769-Amorphochlora_amoeboformis.AAC.1